MNNLVEINNTELRIKEYNGQRVITFKDIDKVHNRIDGMARKAFNRSKKHLVQNEDYFVQNGRSKKIIQRNCSKWFNYSNRIRIFNANKVINR